jgi:hypothetical protein
MEQYELLKYVCRALERIGVKYFVTGSQATIVYGEPRFTNDIDIVVSLDLSQLDAFVDAFPEKEFYLSRAAARDAINQRTMFNVIHPTSGLKVDVVIPGNTPFDRRRFERAKPLQLADDFAPVFASPEDVILKKLEFYKLGESEKHLRDIAGVLKVSGERVDRAFVTRGASQLGVSDIWQAILTRVEQ